MTDDLVAFLWARLDEDEQAAKSALDDRSGVWQIDYAEGTGIDGFVGELVHDDVYVAHIGRNRYDLGNLREIDALHIARWDPARVLAEVQAKRHIIERCEQYARWAANDDGPGFQALEAAGDHMLRLLALPYAGHDSYRAEWAPDTEVNRG